MRIEREGGEEGRREVRRESVRRRSPMTRIPRELGTGGARVVVRDLESGVGGLMGRGGVEVESGARVAGAREVEEPRAELEMVGVGRPVDVSGVVSEREK